MTIQSGPRPAPGAEPAREPLDPELERRVAALESAGTEAGADFDPASWFWIVMLGVAGPAALILWGWFGS